LSSTKIDEILGEDSEERKPRNFTKFRYKNNYCVDGLNGEVDIIAESIPKGAGFDS
jgi:hypothetical protein